MQVSKWQIVEHTQHGTNSYSHYTVKVKVKG